MGKKLYGVLSRLAITSFDDPKYAKVIVIVFKTLKSLIIPHFFLIRYMLTMNIWFNICSNID